MGFRDNTISEEFDSGPKLDYTKLVPSSKEGGIDIPEIGKGRLYFRMISDKPEDVGHFMQFWLNLGLNTKTSQPIIIPKVSPNKFSDFVNTSRGGKKYVGKSAAAHGCPLSKLADAHHPLIALDGMKKDRDGNAALKVNPVHVVPIQFVKVTPGLPARIEVMPEMLLLSMRPTWWKQFVDIVDPVESTTVAYEDGLVSAAAQTTKATAKLPTSDITKVLWYIEKKVRVVNPVPDPKMNVDYVLGFSDVVTLADAQIPAVTNPVSIAEYFKAPEVDELAKMVLEAETRTGVRQTTSSLPASGVGEPVPSPDKPESWGAQVPQPTPLPTAVAVAVAAGVSEDDIPF